MTECSECTSELARESQKVQTATSGTDNQEVQETAEVPHVQHIDMNSQKVPKTVEVSKQQHMDMNVDVPAEMQRQITVTHGRCRKRRKHNRFPSHERKEGDLVEQQRQVPKIRGYRSQYSDKASDASRVKRTP